MWGGVASWPTAEYVIVRVSRSLESRRGRKAGNRFNSSSRGQSGKITLQRRFSSDRESQIPNENNCSAANDKLISSHKHLQFVSSGCSVHRSSLFSRTDFELFRSKCIKGQLPNFIINAEFQRVSCKETRSIEAFNWSEFLCVFFYFRIILNKTSDSLYFSLGHPRFM